MISQCDQRDCGTQSCGSLEKKGGTSLKEAGGLPRGGGSCTVTALEVEVAVPPAGLDSPHFSFFGYQAQVVSLAGQTQVCLCFCCKGCWETTPGLASIMGRCSASCQDAQSGKFPRGAG